MHHAIALPALQNEPLLDFQKDEVRDSITREVSRLRREVLGGSMSYSIAGVPRLGGVPHARENPSDIRETIGTVGFAPKEAVEEAVARTLRSTVARDWARMSLSARAPYLRRVAQKIRERRYLFIALMMLEVGKQAHRADAEVCEAIDFCEHYAAYAEFWEHLGGALLRSPRGEKNTVSYRPYGPRVPICASIQPWNFPLAIATGPTVAALVCGHSVILKPAEQSSIIGHFLAEAIYEAGIPPEVFHFLPGTGEEVGRALVEHEEIAGVSFTGSLAVCRYIEQTLARQNERHRGWRRRAYTLESGGKNPMIVLPDADLNSVIADADESAFGFQGERCSALSRLLFVDEKGLRYGEFMERFAERVRSMPVGSPEDFKNVIGPLVDREAYARVRLYQALAEEEGKIAARGSVPEAGMGYFVPPVLVHGLAPSARVAQEEIFGPVLAVFRTDSVEEAIRLANGSSFALTASIHTNNPEMAARIAREIEAGVVYVNKGTTGAMPGRQNFGGGKDSGNGAKAGDLTYLLPFLHQTHISENTMRCGIPME